LEDDLRILTWRGRYSGGYVYRRYSGGYVYRKYSGGNVYGFRR
jgi:hypothetical protein